RSGCRPIVTLPRAWIMVPTPLALFVIANTASGTTPRTLGTPTSWWQLYGVTPAQIDSLPDSHRARLVDLDVEAHAPYTFTATFVADSGVHAVPDRWWYYDVTEADIAAHLAQNQGRLIDLRRYAVGGSDRFICVMVSNTGGAEKTWWWKPGLTQAQVDSQLTINNARLLRLSPFRARAGVA